MLAVSICRQDRLEEAERFALASRKASAPGDVASQISWRNIQATIEATRGDTASSEILAREAVDLARQTDALPQQAETLRVLAEVLVLANRPSEANALLDEALALYQRKGYRVMAERTSARVAELTAAPS